MSPPEQTLRFRNLGLTNWMNFASASIDLQQRVFLVGPNASGKSNLLDVFRFLFDIVSVGGGFQEAVTRRGGVSSLRYLDARKNPNITIKVTVGNEDEPSWDYELTFGHHTELGPIVHKEIVHMAGKKEPLVSRPNADDRRSPLLLTQTYLEQVGFRQDFSVLADFFASIRYQHVVPQIVRQPAMFVGSRYQRYSNSFIDEMAATPPDLRQERLKFIERVLHYILPRFTELRVASDPFGRQRLYVRYENWRVKGTWQQDDKLSDGTLRLIGLLWAIQSGSGPLLLEEPELSLHPGLVEHIPQMLAQVCYTTGRQILLSTHSTDLLKDSNIKLDEVVMLFPAEQATLVRPASSFEEVRTLLDGGYDLGSIVLSMTSPEDADELALIEPSSGQ